MTLFYIVLAVVAWFVFGFISARIYILDINESGNNIGKAPIGLFISGLIGWMIAMVCAGKGVRARGHFISIKFNPSDDLMKTMFMVKK